MLVERENRLLRRRINSIKRMVDRQIGKEIQMQNCMIDMKERGCGTGREDAEEGEEEEEKSGERIGHIVGSEGGVNRDIGKSRKMEMNLSDVPFYVPTLHALPLYSSPLGILSSITAAVTWRVAYDHFPFYSDGNTHQSSDGVHQTPPM